MRFSSPLAVVVLASTADAFAWPQGWSSGNWNSGGKPSGTAGSTGGNAPAAESHVGTGNKAGSGKPQGGFIGQGGGQGSFTGVPAGFTGAPKGGNGAQFPSFAETFHPPAATGAPDAAPAAATHPAAAAPAAAPSGGPTGGAAFGGFTGGNTGSGANMGGANMGGANMGGANIGSCPPVWLQVSQKLNTMFAGCNDAARASIRAVFHDCFPDGGCDGSIHFPEELSRPENSPMTTTVNALANLANQMGVGVADMLAFAGCKYSHCHMQRHLADLSRVAKAVLICPGGPLVTTMVGRTDATGPCPPNELPAPNVSASDALSHFSARGFNARDLTALIGAHTTSRQFVTVPAKAGAAQDTTPADWDILYYSQTIARSAPVSFVADENLVADGTCGPIFKEFAVDKPGWDTAFADAMARLELLGPAATIDCTKALGAPPTKRDLGSAPLFGAMFHKHKRGSYHSYH
jgi:hypothetical protein